VRILYGEILLHNITFLSGSRDMAVTTIGGNDKRKKYRGSTFMSKTVALMLLRRIGL
jgi:hypothetical protein